jgi:hypothetical protein
VAEVWRLEIGAKVFRGVMSRGRCKVQTQVGGAWETVNTEPTAFAALMTTATKPALDLLLQAGGRDA